MLTLSYQCLPSIASVPYLTRHHHEAETAATEFLSDVRILSITINSTALVHQIFDRGVARQHNECCCPKDEGENRTVFVSPCLKLDGGVMMRQLSMGEDFRMKEELFWIYKPDGCCQ